MELSTWNFQSFLLQNVAFGFKLIGLRMTGVSHTVLLLFLLLLIVNPCVPERAERENSLDLHERNDEGDVTHTDDTSAENQQTVIKHEQEDGSNEETKQREGPSVRSELTNTDFSAVSEG